MQYDTIMGMLFYEFQNVLETYSSILEERREEEEKEYNEKGMDLNPDKMMKNIQNYTSKSPQMPSIPKFDIPKY